MSIAHVAAVGLIRPSHSAITGVNTCATGKERRDSRDGVRRHQIKSTSTGLHYPWTLYFLHERHSFNFSPFLASLPLPLFFIFFLLEYKYLTRSTATPVYRRWTHRVCRWVRVVLVRRRLISELWLG